MKPFLPAFFMFFFFIPHSSCQNGWTKMNPFEGGRSGMASFEINGTAYCGLGADAYSVEGCYSDFYRYDQNNDSWTQISDFPGKKRSNAVAFAIGNYGYVGLGTNTNEHFDDFYKYDPETNQWSSIEKFPGEARHEAIAFVIDGIAYAGTGRGSANYKDMYAYDPQAVSWSRISDHSSKVHDAVAFAIDGKGYVCSGHNIGSMSEVFSGIEEYDPQADTWSEKIFADSKLQNRHYATAWVYDGIAYICGGNDNAQKVLTYNPSTNQVKEDHDFGNELDEFSDPTSFSIGDVAYVLGGKTWEGEFFSGHYVYFDDVWSMNHGDSPTAIIPSKSENPSVKVSPNPSNGIFKIKGLPENAGFTVYNVAGTPVKTGHIDFNKELELNLTSYPEGLFFVHCNNKIIKLIKQ